MKFLSFIKKIIVKIAKLILKIMYYLSFDFVLKDIILFESNPDYSDNTKYVFEELVNRKVNEKVKMIWFVKNKDLYKNINYKNVYFLNRNTFKEKLVFLYYNMFSRYIIDCNNYILKLNKHQFRLHLTHGSPVKIIKEYCNACGKVDYLVSASKEFNDAYSKYYKIDKKYILNEDLPRNDVFYKKNKYKDIIDFKGKKIIWVPTYRNNKNDMFNNHEDLQFKYGIPCIKNEKELVELNKLLKKNNILLVIKLHPAEDTKKLLEVNLDNIRLLKNEELSSNNMTIYDELPYFDAMISDYSSLYYDFLVSKKPLALAIPDFEDYKKNFNLMYDDMQNHLPAVYIYNFDDLTKFINNIAKGIDENKKERLDAINKYTTYNDGNSSKRIADLIINKIKER